MTNVREQLEQRLGHAPGSLVAHMGFLRDLVREEVRCIKNAAEVAAFQHAVTRAVQEMPVEDSSDYSAFGEEEDEE